MIQRDNVAKGELGFRIVGRRHLRLFVGAMLNAEQPNTMRWPLSPIPGGSFNTKTLTRSVSEGAGRFRVESFLLTLRCRFETTSRRWTPAEVEGRPAIDGTMLYDASRKRSCGFSIVTCVLGGTLLVIAQLDPMMELRPMTVSPPRIVAFA